MALFSPADGDVFGANDIVTVLQIEDFAFSGSENGTTISKSFALVETS